MKLRYYFDLEGCLFHWFKLGIIISFAVVYIKKVLNSTDEQVTVTGCEKRICIPQSDCSQVISV